MEKSKFDVQIEEHFDRQHFEEITRTSNFNKSSEFKRTGGNRILRKRVGIIGSPGIAVVKTKGFNGTPVVIDGRVQHANVFKKIGSGLKKAKAKIDKVVLKITPKPLKKVVGKAITAQNKVGAAVGKVASKLISYPVLIPLMPVMGAALKKAGMATPSNIPEKRAQQFYTIVIKKDKWVDPDNVKAFDRRYNDHVIAAIATIVSVVVKFVADMVKKKKAKKAAGNTTPMDPVDEVVGTLGETLLGNLNDKLINSKTAPMTSNSSVLREPLTGESPLIQGDEPRGGMASDMGAGGTDGKGRGNKGTLSFSNPMVIGGILLVVVVGFFALRKN